jgi:Tol biopolymer transport system component
MIPPTLTQALADRYRIERELGSGGMATVYLADDLKHRRKVAIKVLRSELAAVIGASRFLKEIETTANLQHPHILPLFDSGEVNGTVFYVMPFVEGESLRDRLTREKQLPIADAVRMATEVASALDYAHRHGVIHRDIKPENILLHDGTALVADFGIALAASKAGSSRMTETGMSLGTPHYMSPEQAMGEREITARSDVYALGAVLYEMLVGDPPFTGSTAQAIVAKVMTEKPAPLRRQRERIPEQVEDAVFTALEKLPADRFGTAADFAAALAEETAGRRDRSRTGSRASFTRPVFLWSAAAVVAAIAVGAFLLGGRILGRPAPPLEFGQSIQVTSEPGLEVQPAISPDGKSVAYAAGTSAGTRIYVRQITGGRASPVTSDSSSSETNPRWSPDGTRILFLARGAVYSAPAAGGPARQEVPASNLGPVVSADWAPDGATIAYVVTDSLFIRAPAGEIRNVARIIEPSLCTWSPNGSLIACASGNARYLTVGVQFGNLSPSRIVILRVSDGSVTTVTDSTSLNVSPTWSPDGRWLFYVSSRRGPRDIYGLRIGRGGRTSGQPVRLSTGLGAQSITISKDGTRFAYAVYSATANVWSLPLPSRGPVSAKTATPVTSGAQVIENIHATPDGRWLVYESDLAGNSDIYRLPLQGGDPERLTSDPADDFAGDLSPDGREIAFHSWRSGSRDIYVLPLDGRPLQRVTSSPEQELMPTWSPEGTSLAFNSGNETRSVWVVRRGQDGAWGQPVERIDRGTWATWSPDGRYLAYVDRMLGGSIRVIPADSGVPRLVLDAAQPGMPTAELPYWDPDGRTIYFKSHDAKSNASFWSIPVAGGTPRQLVYFDDPTWPSYRPQWALGRGRIFFPVEDRQSNVWVMERAMERGDP